MSKPIPQVAIDTLPQGYTILGHGGDFLVKGPFEGLAISSSAADGWSFSCCWLGYDDGAVFAALTDSEIVRLNQKGSEVPNGTKGVHDFDLSDYGEDRSKEVDLDQPVYLGSLPSEKTLIPEDDAERSKYPIGTYITEYCPNALLALSRHSYEANEKHNAGEPIHWAKEKSVGSINRIFRHLFEFSWHYARGERDKAQYHLTAGAWRTNELLERYLTNMEPFNTKD